MSIWNWVSIPPIYQPEDVKANKQNFLKGHYFFVKLEISLLEAGKVLEEASSGNLRKDYPWRCSKPSWGCPGPYCLPLRLAFFWVVLGLDAPPKINYSVIPWQNEPGQTPSQIGEVYLGFSIAFIDFKYVFGQESRLQINFPLQLDIVILWDTNIPHLVLVRDRFNNLKLYW